MTQNYIEIVIPATVDSGELCGLLQESGLLGAWETAGHLRLCWPAERWRTDVLNDLKRALDAMGAAGAADIVVRSIPDRDWNASWMKSLEPFRIGSRFRIRQSWNPSDASFGGIELVIDPKRAFGAGSHATTQLVVEWLETNIRPGERVLDVGTGTGILAMAALRLGAGLALGIDNDRDAIECARENAVVNGFGAELELRVAAPNVLGPSVFDVIVANLDLKTILGCFDRCRKCLTGRGRMCLSGLRVEDVFEVVTAVEATGSRVVGRWQRDEWVAIEVSY